MPTKLKNLRITSVDLVDEGANQEAHVSLLKRKATDFVAGLMPKKETSLILPTKGGARATSPLAETKEKNHISKEETTMTLEEQTILDAAALICKKCGFAEKEVEKSETAEEKSLVEKVETTEDKPISEEVAKALAENDAMMKSYQAKVEALEKQLAMGELETIAKKYELLGNEPKALAEKLYAMKQKGSYEDYIAVLDQSLALVEKSGIFQEIGTNTTGLELSSLSQLVEDIQKRDGCTKEKAFLKAYEENGDFARAYDHGYITTY